MTFAFLRNTSAFTAALLGAALIGGATPATAATLTYSDPACDSFTIDGANGSFTLRCVPTSAPGAPGAPTGCVARITSTSPSPLTKDAGTVNLDVSSCSPSTGLTYNWYKNGSANWQAVQSPSDTLPANTGQLNVQWSYQVKVCVEGGACTGLLPSLPLTATQPGSGGVSAGLSCATQGFTKTMFYNWDWAAGGKFVQTYNDSQGPLGSNGIVVIAFKPTVAGTTNGSIVVSEYPATSTNSLGTTRAVAISEQPCDFSGSTVAYGTRFGYNAGNGFTVAPAFMRAMAQLTVGRQYYLNIANRDSSGKPTCTSGCEVRIQSTHP